MCNKESIDWEELERLSYSRLNILRKLENTLLKYPQGINADELMKKIGIPDKTVRTLQNQIKWLKELYIGKQTISRSPYKLNLNGDDMAFPEQVFNSNDRKQLNSICKLIAFFDGAVPIKSLLQVIDKPIDVLQDALNRFSSDIDTPTSAKELIYIKTIYDSIESRSLLEVTYRMLEGSLKTVEFAPYLLKRYNNKWFVLGREYVYDPFECTCIPLARIENVAYYSKNKYKYIPNEEDKLTSLKSRIDSYYKSIIGFYVPKSAKQGNAKKIDIENLKIENVVLEFKGTNTIKLVEENPIHNSQKIDYINNIVTLKVVINPLLIKTILGYGNNIKVLQPKVLRDEMESIIKSMYATYCICE